MIAVIADDLTGAAELAGIGLNYGLNVEISAKVPSVSQIDLLVIATDTRSKTEDEAVADMLEVTKQIALLKPEFIFKKVDSVLRGYIVSEINAQLKVLEYKKALLIPANPALGRTIENGNYLIDGIPISQTGFSSDPEFPARHSVVLDLLKSDPAVHVRKYSDPVMENGITVGETKSDSDLLGWAKLGTKDVLLAGASGFFRAVLSKAGFIKKANHQSSEILSGPLLYVFGSAFSKSKDIAKNILSGGGPVYYLPEALINGKDNNRELDRCSDEICNLININEKAIIAIDALKEIPVSALELRTIMAQLVKKVFNKVNIKELIIEGGSTASAILKSLEIETLKPVNEYATGVIRSKVNSEENLYVTLKPGSYSWPNQVLTF
ncbi:four-carbon acid sugar kinase family protein [Pedobacter sp. P351]|uniref:four-carbon acid sugar kinase family protein n=1 Tax=Pedobacter superstes TaxID=3133441 RepID=UPI0030ABBE1C